MMFNYPYFNSPYFNRYSRYGYRYSYLDKNKNFNYVENENIKKPDCVTPEKCNNSSHTINNDTNGSPIFEIFGIKLYFDDILLVCLIFFLYDEGVKDQSLFIALILLLLS